MSGAAPLGPTLSATLVASLTVAILRHPGTGFMEAPPSCAAPDAVTLNRNTLLWPGSLLVL